MIRPPVAGRGAWMAALAALGCLLVPAGASASPDPRPNVVVITTDDQWLSSLDQGAMPRTEWLVGERGATFTQAVVTTPLCCPSRASFLTGQYAHNHGVVNNFPGYGSLLDPGNVLPVWLRRSGYATAHIGKWLNNYGGAVGDPAKVAPGWREWHTIVSDNDDNLRYYAYNLRENGDSVHFGREDDDHLSRVITERALETLRAYVPEPEPLYLQVDHLAPHTSPDPRLPCRRAAKPDPLDVGLFDDRVLPVPPSFNEEDVSDKNTSVSGREQFDEERVADMTRKYRCALASLVAVDRSVDRIVRTLRKLRELGRTVLVFTSDNGYFYGEHRLTQKSQPYDEGVRVPLMVRLPEALRAGAPEGLVLDQAVANIDLAPTILELTGALPCRPGPGCRTLDGRSLLPLLRGDEASWPADRALEIELRRSSPGNPAGDQVFCSYQGLRTPSVAYFEFFNALAAGLPCPLEEDLFAQPESYDLVADPFQLESLGADSDLADRLAELRDCAGIADRVPPDPVPASGHYCE